jgi:hypothetical protein
MNVKQYWYVRKGESSASLLARDYAGAVERAAQIGFQEFDSLVLDENQSIFNENKNKKYKRLLNQTNVIKCNND